MPRRPTLLALTAVLVASSTPARAQVECNGMTCPVGDACYADQCVPPCKNDEFPCSSGTTCFAGPDLDLRLVCANPGFDDCYCLPSRCQNVDCEPGWICRERDGQCYDPCANVTCPEDQQCHLGQCLDCYSLGCPDCYWCVDGRCQTDACCGCPLRQACDPATATCVPLRCEEVGCDGDFVCCGGGCVPNPCYYGAIVDCFECGPCLPDLTTCPPTHFYCAGCPHDGGSASDAAGPQTRGRDCGCHAGGTGASGLPLVLVVVLRRRRGDAARQASQR